jgi:hypothetical protein
MFTTSRSARVMTQPRLLWADVVLGTRTITSITRITSITSITGITGRGTLRMM